MKNSIRIGRIFGIDLIIDWSWLLIMVLISWNLISAFSEYHPDWGMQMRLGIAIMATILFFISLLAHELAHSLMARFRGIPVRKIMLFLFGGVSNIQREPDSPSSKFLITIVGPLTSIGLGFLISSLAGFWIADFPTKITTPDQLASQMGPLTTLLFWLASATPQDDIAVLLNKSDNRISANSQLSEIKNCWVCYEEGISFAGFGCEQMVLHKAFRRNEES